MTNEKFEDVVAEVIARAHAVPNSVMRLLARHLGRPYSSCSVNVTTGFDALYPVVEGDEENCLNQVQHEVLFFIACGTCLQDSVHGRGNGNMKFQAALRDIYNRDDISESEKVYIRKLFRLRIYSDGDFLRMLAKYVRRAIVDDYYTIDMYTLACDLVEWNFDEKKGVSPVFADDDIDDIVIGADNDINTITLKKRGKK